MAANNNLMQVVDVEGESNPGVMIIMVYPCDAFARINTVAFISSGGEN